MVTDWAVEGTPAAGTGAGPEKSMARASQTISSLFK